jgi:hypothetical protein
MFMRRILSGRPLLLYVLVCTVFGPGLVGQSTSASAAEALGFRPVSCTEQLASCKSGVGQAYAGQMNACNTVTFQPPSQMSAADAADVLAGMKNACMDSAKRSLDSGMSSCQTRYDQCVSPQQSQ